MYTIRYLGEDLALFACARGHRAFELQEVAVYEESGPCMLGCEPPRGTVKLVGALVAYPYSNVPECKYFPPCRNVWRVIVRDLRTGGIVHMPATGEPESPPAPEAAPDVGVGPAIKIVLRADGSVAWTVKSYQPLGYEVHVADRRGARTLASGPDIDPQSLTLTGSTIHWTQRGESMSAPVS